MADQLAMANIRPILTLCQRGWSNRRVARTLGVHRKAVARYVRLACEAGFRDAIQMRTVFRRVGRITPSDYRRQHGLK
jgi:transcriptional regulator GlxA family with amidase domain